MKISELEKYSLAELNGLLDDVIAQIKTHMYEEGYKDASKDSTSKAPVSKTPQQIRDEIIEKAKRDVAKLENSHHMTYEYADFVVNREKRTIVAVIKSPYLRRVTDRGVAKCDPSDCFNVHIGKAIALRRALGLEMPSEYLNAPQPTEARVGDVVRGNGSSAYYSIEKIFTLISECGEADDTFRFAEDKSDFIYRSQIGVIVDDSREGVAE